MKRIEQNKARAGWGWLLGCWLIMALLGGCSDELDGGFKGEANKAVVRLDRLTPMPARVYDQQANAVKMAVAAMLSPGGTVMSYRPLQSYLEQKLGRPVQLIQRRTYQEVNEMLARNLVDFAFVCTGAFVAGQEQGIMELLVIPRIEGRETYQALLIAAADSAIRSLDDMRGKVFAFTDPLSNTGYLYPMSRLRKRGESVESFFGRIIFTYSHDNSIAAVADGVVDAASVDSIVFAHTLRREPELAGKIRVIERSREFGMPPVAVSSQADPAARQRYKEILLAIHEDPAGADVLAALGVERFVEPNPDLYR